MSEAVFFRLLEQDIDVKSAVLESQVTALNAGDVPDLVFTILDSVFGQIPGSPFAYWASRYLPIFIKYPPFDNDHQTAKRGPSTGDDFRRVRAWWEVQPQNIDRTRRWVPFAKGGAYSLYYADVYLLVDWDDQRSTFRDFYGRPGRETPKVESSSYFFRSGLTYIARSMKGFCVRVLPQGCVFAHVSPGIFAEENSELLPILAILSSTLVGSLLEISLSRGSETSGQTKAFEVGQVQRLPFAAPSDRIKAVLTSLSSHAYDLQRENFVHDETTHVFGLPGLVEWRGDSLVASSLTLEELADQRQDELAQVQAQIDELVFDLYGLDAVDRQLVAREMGTAVASDEPVVEDDESEEDEPALPDDLPARVQNLLMWCVGVAFGRWDVRKALDRSLISDLPGPFDPLPRCAPGALVNAAGLPSERDDMPNDYPLPIAWDGVLVDDPEQENMPKSRDIVARVRGVLTLLWGNNADGIEREICAVLNIRDLRDYFRNPAKGFFGFHIKRYSKSRRKAPIYWLLQSEKRSIAVWLYYPRINDNTLFTAENIIHDQLRREQFRLNELKDGLEAFSGVDRKQRERDIDAQTRLVEEIATFHRALLRLANLRLPPDYNDGVLVSIAPLHELVPWKEAGKMWDKLKQGDYTWSSMSEQMRRRGLIHA